MSRRPSPFVSIPLLALLVAAVPAAAEVDPALLAGMKARAIGPAGMSGRIGDITALPEDPDTIYVGAASGGLWRSTNGGLTFTPIFDDQPVASIGAVAVAPGNPDVIWVGTGEGNPRNSASVGNGVYKSIDGGDTWTHLGLDRTEKIDRVALHPHRPEVAWVAALGTSWAESEERGVYKTSDGGKTWQKVLYVNETTGAADLVVDPRNPDHLFAALWDHRRWPWSLRSGGPGSGLHVTWDGGATWKRLGEDDGLPKGELGRIGLATCPSDPDVVYALVEAEKSAFLRSEDGGKSFRTMTTDPEVSNRPFYYADIRCDPQASHRIYNLASRLTVSEDGGKTFERVAGSNRVHSDFQALWIDPNDSSHLVVGDDGGVSVSRDRGATWRFVATLCPKAATSSAGTSRRAARSRSSPPRTAARSCASIGTPPWPSIRSTPTPSTTAASTSTSRPTAARAGRSSARISRPTTRSGRSRPNPGASPPTSPAPRASPPSSPWRRARSRPG